MVTGSILAMCLAQLIIPHVQLYRWLPEQHNCHVCRLCQRCRAQCYLCICDCHYISQYNRVYTHIYLCVTKARR